MTLLLAIDPGPTVCGWLIFDTVTERVCGAEVLPVDAVLANLMTDGHRFDALAIETFEARGMPLGNESLETLIVTGQIIREWERERTDKACRVKRSAVKLHLCGNNRAKDPNVNAAVRDRFGGKSATVSPKAARPATRKRDAVPARGAGTLYGVASHAWAALAVAVTWADTHTSSGIDFEQMPF